MRIFEFAKLVDLPARELVGILQDNGFSVKSHMSVLSDEAFLFLDKKFGKIKQAETPAPSELPIVSTVEKKMQKTPMPVSSPSVATPALPTLDPVAPAIETKSLIVEPMTVHDLALRIGKSAQDVILFLLKSGTAAAKNSVVSEDIVRKIARHFEIPTASPVAHAVVHDKLAYKYSESHKGLLQDRPPIVVVVGHVDHGKTTLLDYIRKTRVALREKGGITQHLGAYEADTGHGSVVFIDTPGHEAFPKMRERGIRVADIAVLVIAADDGIKPQTVEAIRQVKEMDVPVVVAINKMDKVDASRAEIVKRELAQYDFLAEDWGGKVVCVPISAKTGAGVDHLLEMLVLQAQLMELKASSVGLAHGYVLESKMEKGRGPVATVIVQTGSAKRGDYFICGSITGRITSLVDSSGRKLNDVGPAKPVQVAGFNELPRVGDSFIVVEKEGLKNRQKESLLSQGMANRLTKEGSVNLVLKVDSNSSREALIDALDKFSRKLHKGFNIVSSGIGPVTASDVELAYNTGSRIVTLHVRSDSNAQLLAQKRAVSVTHYDVIYRLLEDLQLSIESDKPVHMVRTKIGEAIVRKVFDIKGVGVVAGSYLREGRFVRNGIIIAYRGRQKIGEGKMTSLQRDKKIVKEVHTGFEFGVVVEGITDWQIDDRIECYIETAG